REKPGKCPAVGTIVVQFLRRGEAAGARADLTQEIPAVAAGRCIEVPGASAHQHVQAEAGNLHGKLLAPITAGRMADERRRRRISDEGGRHDTGPPALVAGGFEPRLERFASLGPCTRTPGRWKRASRRGPDADRPVHDSLTG